MLQREREYHWTSEVENCLQGCIDLVAVEAVYHDKRLTTFMQKRDHTIREKQQVSGTMSMYTC